MENKTTFNSMDNQELREDDDLDDTEVLKYRKMSSQSDI